MKRNWFVINSFILICSLYLLASLFITEIIVKDIKSEQNEIAKNEFYNELSYVRANIESFIFSEVYVANTLATILTSDQTFGVSRFDSLSETLLSQSKYIKNIGISEGYTITQVYPLEGNQKAIGFDFRTIPEQFKTVEQARIGQTVVMAGPVSLVQGGRGLIARYPIFSDFPINNDYWGGVSVVFNIDDLLRDAGLLSLNERYDIALKSKLKDAVDGEAFFGDTKILRRPEATVSIDLPGEGGWVMVGRLKENSSSGPINISLIIRLLCYFLSLALLGLAILLYRAYQYATVASYKDELTKLPNRRYAMEILEKKINRREDTPFGLISVDLNRFKYINDHYGHEAGDFILQQVSQALLGSVRQSDFVFRLGGDEFLILVDGMGNTEGLERIVQTIKKAVDGKKYLYKKNELVISLSAGYASYPKDSQDLDELMSLSDFAMFKDKKDKER